MVVPLGGLDMPAESLEAPGVVKEYHVFGWWFIVFSYNLLVIARFVALDVFGGLNSALVAFLAWYLVNDKCAKMSQCCVLVFGILCLTNGFFDLLPLMASVGGRTTESTENQPTQDGSKVYSVTIEKHPFYDPSQGDYYNFQSLMMIVSPVMMFLGAAMASKTYNAFPTYLFADIEEEASRPLGGQPRYGGHDRPGGGGYGRGG